MLIRRKPSKPNLTPFIGYDDVKRFVMRPLSGQPSQPPIDDEGAGTLYGVNAASPDCNSEARQVVEPKVCVLLFLGGTHIAYGDGVAWTGEGNAGDIAEVSNLDSRHRDPQYVVRNDDPMIQ